MNEPRVRPDKKRLHKSCSMICEKLGPQPAETLRAMRAYGLSDQDLGRYFGISAATISRIQRLLVKDVGSVRCEEAKSFSVVRAGNYVATASAVESPPTSERDALTRSGSLEACVGSLSADRLRPLLRVLDGLETGVILFTATLCPVP